MQLRTALVPLFATSSLLYGGPAPETVPPVTMSVHQTREGAPVAPTMHGLFFEDINYAADGGLYAELLQNRSFEHENGMWSWEVQGDATLLSENPLHPNNPHFLRLKLAETPVTLSNSGFGGIPLEKQAAYRFSIFARKSAGSLAKTPLSVRLESQDGTVLASENTGPLTQDWSQYELTLHPNASTPDARIVIAATGQGTLDVDMVSLFPKDTWKDRKNGLRRDLAQALADLHPGFLRFPGGCIVEGNGLANAYRWKDTVGPVEQRKQNWNLWQDKRGNDATQHYYQTYGLGFFEFFQLCEDLGCEPVPVLNCGMACQFRSPVCVPIDELGPWVQDALDLVEFAKGPVTSPWGKIRADMGHPAPFTLTMLGIGNEQWGEEYFERYQIFAKALRTRYPDLKLISTSGPGVDDANSAFAWKKFKSGTPADIVDEHYYRPPEWFYANHSRYDRYDRTGPKIFAGEFAAHDKGKASTLRAALAEAIGMTGMVRNADVVTMTAYAPLLAKAGATQWTPDLIWFDNTRVHLTPSYHVQAMFARSRPDHTVPVEIVDQPVLPKGRVGVGTWATTAEFRNIKLTHNGSTLDLDQAAQAESPQANWDYSGGTLKQTSLSENCRFLLGPEISGNFTLNLQARKTGGTEGFLILFDNDEQTETSWWNIGGWQNSSHAIQAPGIKAEHVPGAIQQGKWYDIRIESTDGKLSCFLDGKLIHTTRRTPQQRVYASAGVDRKSGECILQAVNPGNDPIQANIQLDALESATMAKIEVLTSARLDDVNSFEDPKRVMPVTSTMQVPGAHFTYLLPARSLSILRIPTH